MPPLGNSPFSTPPIVTPPKEPEKKSGPIIGIIIIVLLLALGGLYFWGARLNARDRAADLPLIPGDPVPATQ